MGLFIGASLLTILEILDYLCEVGLGPSFGRGKPGPRWGEEEVWADLLPDCLSPGVPRQGPGILLESEALPKALQHPSGNNLLFLPCHLHLMICLSLEAQLGKVAGRDMQDLDWVGGPIPSSDALPSPTASGGAGQPWKSSA